jgi:universal stress protein E
MATISKIFAVIDPTTDNQIALVRAGKIAGRNENIAVHVYEALYSNQENSDKDALRRVETARHQAWLESLVAPLRESGIKVDVEIEWTSDWRDAIAPAAQRAGADLIIKAATAHSGAERRLLKTSDWSLLRNAPCPVYQIKKDAISQNIKVLMAIDVSRTDALHSKLNELVMDYGKSLLVGAEGASLFVVNAYPNSEKFIYKEDLAEKTGVDPANAYTVEGLPEKVIPEVAEQVQADIVIVGTAAREGLKAAVIGNTAEKLLDAISTNILTVNAH